MFFFILADLIPPISAKIGFYWLFLTHFTDTLYHKIFFLSIVLTISAKNISNPDYFPHCLGARDWLRQSLSRTGLQKPQQDKIER